LKLPDVDKVAAKVHESWMQSKRNLGVLSRKSEKGEELMVPYEKLTNESQELDRASVRAVYSAIESLSKEGE